MADIVLTVTHPTDNETSIEIKTRTDIAVGEVISQLIELDFMPSACYYALIMSKDGKTTSVGDNSKKLEELEAEDGGTLKIVANAKPDCGTSTSFYSAGFMAQTKEEEPKVTIISHNGIDFSKLKSIDANEFLKMAKSSTVAINMILHDYRDKLEKNERLCGEVEVLRNRAHAYEIEQDSKTISAVLLVVAPLITTIAGILFTTSFPTFVGPSIIVLLIGIFVLVMGLLPTLKILCSSKNGSKNKVQ